MSDFNSFEHFSTGQASDHVSFPKREAVEYIREHVNSRWLKKPADERGKQIGDRVFNNNQQFWETVLQLPSFIGFRNVTLRNFQIIDWYPRAPGYAYTLAAARAQRKAHKHFEKGSSTTYTPTGKEYMIKGGIGSYRFAPFEYKGTTYYLCSATTDNYCHTGIPLAIPEIILENINFAWRYTLIGQYQIIPDPLRNQFRHYQGIPKFYLRVDEVKQAGNVNAPVNITPVIFMRGQAEENLVSYATCRADQADELDNIAEWLAEYARHYKSEIITYYDEQRPAFSDAPFSLQRLTAEELDLIKLKELGIPVSNVTHHREVVMKKVDNSKHISIQGDHNIVADNIHNSFNQIQSSGTSDEIKVLLKDLVEKVGELSKALSEDEAQTVMRDLETFTKEATKDKPRKKMLDISLESIKKAAENVRDVGAPVFEIVGKLLPLIIAAAQ